MSLNEFLATLFSEHEQTCFSPNPYGTEVRFCPEQADVFFSINPLQQRRLDVNVTSFRNLLIEIDNMPLEAQEEYVRNTLPVTSQVFSGSKSYHFIISLEKPLPDINAYRETWLRLQKLLPRIDKACKNPSRLSRLPFRIRPETGLEQKLHFLGSRIKTEELLAMLPELEYDVVQEAQSRTLVRANLLELCIKPDEAIVRIGLAGRNAFFHFLYERMKDEGLGTVARRKYVDIAYDNLKNVENFSKKEAYAAARIYRK